MRMEYHFNSELSKNGAVILQVYPEVCFSAMAQWNTSSEPNLAVQLAPASVYVTSIANRSPLPFGRHAPDLA